MGSQPSPSATRAAGGCALPARARARCSWPHWLTSWRTSSSSTCPPARRCWTSSPLAPPSGAPLLDELAAGPALRRAAARRALRWTRCRRVPPLGPAAARAGHGFRLQWVRRRQVALQFVQRNDKGVKGGVRATSSLHEESSILGSLNFLPTWTLVVLPIEIYACWICIVTKLQHVVLEISNFTTCGS